MLSKVLKLQSPLRSQYLDRYSIGAKLMSCMHAAHPVRALEASAKLLRLFSPSRLVVSPAEALDRRSDERLRAFDSLFFVVS